jgi:hypothetical protein
LVLPIAVLIVLHNTPEGSKALLRRHKGGTAATRRLATYEEVLSGPVHDEPRNHTCVECYRSGICRAAVTAFGTAHSIVLRVRFIPDCCYVLRDCYDYHWKP